MQAAATVLPGYSGVIPTPYNEFWYVQVKLSPVDQLTKEIGSQTGEYFFNFPTLAANMPAGITY